MSWFILDSTGGGEGAGAGGGATCVVRWKERAATREDKSLRDASRLDVAGGKGVAKYPAWAEVRFSTSEVRKVTEAPRSLTMAIS